MGHDFDTFIKTTDSNSSSENSDRVCTYQTNHERVVKIHEINKENASFKRNQKTHSTYSISSKIANR